MTADPNLGCELRSKLLICSAHGRRDTLGRDYRHRHNSPDGLARDCLHLRIAGRGAGSSRSRRPFGPMLSGIAEV